MNKLPPLFDTPASSGQKYIITDPVAAWTAHYAVSRMGGKIIAALLLDGPPGCGKTFMGEKIADFLGAKMLYFPFFPGAGKAELITDKVGDRYVEGILPRAIRESREQKIVLLLDEQDKATVEVDSFLLGFFSSRVIDIPQLGGRLEADSANLFVVITKNDARDLSDPLLRRCDCVNMEWPSPDVELEIFTANTDNPNPKLGQALIKIANEMRRNQLISKPPSINEILRVAGDLYDLATHEEDRTLGLYLIKGLLPKMRDRRQFTDAANPNYLGAMVREQLTP